ncbi:MAG: hypothetical protein ACLFR9_10240 [Desulfobacterales bacterium]
MAKSKCPVCGCEQFYVTSPYDEYEVYEFECSDGEACFDPDAADTGCPEITGSTEIYCNACSWHDKFSEIS